MLITYAFVMYWELKEIVADPQRTNKQTHAQTTHTDTNKQTNKQTGKQAHKTLRENPGRSCRRPFAAPASRGGRRGPLHTMEHGGPRGSDFGGLGSRNCNFLHYPRPCTLNPKLKGCESPTLNPQIDSPQFPEPQLPETLNPA